MISIEHLSKTYTVHGQTITALKDINLSVAPKEIYGIIGRSGAGKSTLIRCVNLLERPNSGRVMMEGICFTTMNRGSLLKARRQMGMIFQNFNLLQSRTVAQNIALPLELAGTSRAHIRARVNELLALVHLESHDKHYPSQLSGGQKQRVAIARALATSPKILLCDEATSALDPQSTQSILALLRSINQALGITIMLITHEMDVIKTLCDRVGILHAGELIEERPVIELFTDPKTDLAKDFVRTSARMHLPDFLKDILVPTPIPNGGTILRIAYHGGSASQPILSHLIKHYPITINILQGNIETIQNQIAGIMIVEIKGSPESVASSCDFLTQHGLHIEILGYVQRDP